MGKLVRGRLTVFEQTNEQIAVEIWICGGPAAQSIPSQVAMMA
ncbi:MAG: hypothetical protein V2I76_10845 [Roseobacter sp.]|nr:hypothetical protein [Roseobacter sp.]